jgi:hypothetical protein
MFSVAVFFIAAGVVTWSVRYASKWWVRKPRFVWRCENGRLGVCSLADFEDATRMGPVDGRIHALDTRVYFYPESQNLIQHFQGGNYWHGINPLPAGEGPYHYKQDERLYIPSLIFTEEQSFRDFELEKTNEMLESNLALRFAVKVAGASA